MTQRIDLPTETMETIEDDASLSSPTLLAGLLTAADMPTLATRIVDYAERHWGSAHTTVLWWLDEQQAPRQYPEDELSDAQRALVQNAIASPDQVARSVDTGQLAMSIFPDDSHAGVVLLVDSFYLRSHPSVLKALPELLGPCVGNALDKHRLHESMRHLEQAEQLQRALFAIADLASSDMEMSQVLQELHAIVAGLMYAENFYIALYDSDKDTIRFIHFVDVEDHGWSNPDTEIPLGQIEHSLTWHLVRGRRPLRGSIEEIERQVSGPLTTLGTACADWLGVPMLNNHAVRGMICVQSYIDRPRYTEADQALLSYVASHILTALYRKQVQEELENRVQQRTRELTIEMKERQRSERLQATLFRIAELSNTAINLGQFYVAVHRIVGQWLDSRNFYIALLSEDGSQLHFPYFVDEYDSTPQPRFLSNGITEFVLRNGKPLLVDFADSTQRAKLERLCAAGELTPWDPNTVCWLGVPLICANRAVGVLAVQSYTPGVFYTSRDQELLAFISYQIANGLERQRAAVSLKTAYATLEQRVTERTQQLREQISVRQSIELQLKHEVLHDSLTGLPNRAYLREHLIRAMERRRRDPTRIVAVLFMDLDRFKVINDSAGHLVGDELLKEVAVRFIGCARAPDVVARLGGDEFAILMEDIRCSKDALRVAQRVIEALREPVRVAGKELFTSVSVGIAVSDSRYQQAEELLRDADIAMYRAKANGQQRFELFDERLHQQALHMLDLEGELRLAILRQEFEPYFQPIVRLADGSVVGYEALLRWNHPSRGVLAPGAFLHVAEVSGCLEAIDWQVLDLICAAIPRLVGPGEYVNLNFSPHHFRSKDLDTRLLSIMAAHGVAPNQVRIEVAEGALMDKPEQVSRMLDGLRQAGVLTALDDFGTGYSSLSYLHRFQLHAVKIDRSFVSDLVPGEITGGSAVVRVILALSSSLELEVVAEGIETPVQRDALRELGCTLGQGYWFAHPQPLEQLLESR